ncbi:pilus assembly protein PilZ [Pseudomonas sp. PIC25]|uniref:PilZ domain-containing protein n=1 Tax=Pseudomonas sp. PIC25 TaxID=1958773 RepID=UPI000BAB3DC6|nr:PilZ domain-containing protein [Pseudomonas sp. PIC25]PAU65262.1 pilus assembly protein PilZ [Pseudomonas sp. PIC25]
MRRFLRHPSEMPVELVLGEQTLLPSQRLHNISLGGVACNSSCGFPPGTPIELRIPLLGDDAHYAGVVAWCRKQEADYLIGIAFVDEDNLFRARMVEQICHIEQYRRQREQETGEAIPVEACAQEWISRHAADFAQV